MAGVILMETKQGFFFRNKAYILVGFGFILLTIWYFWLATIADIGYVYHFLLNILKGDFSGSVQPVDSLGHYKQEVSVLFGPNYNTIAPEVIRSFNERQHILPYVFMVEFLGFLIAFIIQKGRKHVEIKHPEDKIKVYSLFQRTVIFLNIVMVIYIFITGFSITFGNWTGGGEVASFMRKTHEIVGLAWIPIWLFIMIIAFKDIKIFKKQSLFFLAGRYTPLKRINYYMFVIFGFVLVVSGFLIWYLFAIHAPVPETIQLRRLLLFFHFMGSAILSFFLFDTVYAYFVSVGGYLPSVISGKAYREYLEEVDPSILEEVSKK